MSNTSELACVYASLILADDGVSVTSDKILSILKAAKVEVEPYWPGLFAKCSESCDIKDLLTSVSSGVGAAPAAAAASAAPAEDKSESKAAAKKEEKEESEDEDMGFGLFD